MTAKEIKRLRSYGLNSINDEDIVQDLLLKIIENNLNFKRAINYIKLSAKGSIFYRKKFEIEEFKETLSQIKLHVLNLTLEGFTVREICKKLKISSKTCTKILKSIRLKALEYFAFGEANPPKGSLGESLGPLGKENKNQNFTFISENCQTKKEVKDDQKN